MTEPRSIRRSVGWWARAIQVRLRFILVLVAATVVVGGWDTWRTYWDRWIAPAGRDPGLGAVSGNTEYFCPMDPGVLSGWSGKCPVCNMTLVSRIKGDMTPLPSGVVARVQLSPARVQLGGIATAAVEFRPLERTVRLPGEDVAEILKSPMADHEPFRSMPSDLPPLKPKEPRSLYLCADHPDVVRLEAGSCPKDGNSLMRLALAADQRVGWWCPMHPKLVGRVAGSKCDECGGMALVPRVVTYRPKGQVLAVPETAVIDTGARRVVYVESMPGTFDAVEVVLGPRCGTFYPVVSGLEPGQKVAAAGAFLIDAETRLNPSLATAYFGASRPASSPPEAPKATLDFSGLSAADLALATAQKTCPVTKKPLGSMGSPVKMAIGGRSVFVCCDGCVQTLKDKPEKYLNAESGPAHHP